MTKLVLTDLTEEQAQAALRAVSGPRNAIISLWVQVQKKLRWRSCANHDNLTVTSWAERHLDVASKKHGIAKPKKSDVQEQGENTQMQMKFPQTKKDIYAQAAETNELKPNAWIEIVLDKAAETYPENIKPAKKSKTKKVH